MVGGRQARSSFWIERCEHFAGNFPKNQLNARARLAEGLNPPAVINWLAANDAQGNPTQRQYGVATLQNGAPMAAAYTGVNCLDVKGHRVGPSYSIQGNILLNPGILDSMEARFRAAGGCLANKLMAAMQGANVPGADSRCLDNGTSAMFAFLKVAKPGDSAGTPSLRLFVSYDPLGIEPIDSLQALFDANFVCLSDVDEAASAIPFSVVPNPSTGDTVLGLPENLGAVRLDIFDMHGRLLQTLPAIGDGQPLSLNRRGLLLLRVVAKDGRTGLKKVVVE